MITLETINQKMSIADRIEYFINQKKGLVASLKELYKYISDKPEETVRAAIYKDSKDRFLRVGKGMYMLNGEKTSSLIIQGDGRSLSEIEDSSIDCIITDHPWSDKKAHSSGNQKSFADYESFRYTQEDFDNKARVLKEGSFLVEFLPVESFSNYEYLYQIKEMAKKAGFSYYAKVIWRKAKEGTINTGRTTKGVEEIMIFSKGKKTRRLSESKNKPYYTRNMLNFEINIPANKGKNKRHQAEKNVELYEYLIENLTEEGDVCLDQFSGSCNIVEAALNKNRFAIAYELCKNFVSKAVDRLGCFSLFTDSESNLEAEDSKEEGSFSEEEESVVNSAVDEVYKNTGSMEVKLNFIESVRKKRASLLTEKEMMVVENISGASTEIINELFNSIISKGYSQYKTPTFNISLFDLSKIEPALLKLEALFNESFNDDGSRDINKYILLEGRAYIEYLVYNGLDFCDLKELLNEEHVAMYERYRNEFGFSKSKLVSLLSFIEKKTL